MSLIKRGQIFHYDFVFEGERHQGSTGMRNRRDAERAESALKADLARRKFCLPAKSVRFSEVCDSYAKVAQTNAKPAYITEKYHISAHLKPHFGEIMVYAISSFPISFTNSAALSSVTSSGRSQSLRRQVKVRCLP
jgi:hypothetical protein